MADHVELNPGTGGAVVATDEEVGVAQHQLVKVEWGADGTFTKVAAGASALPIQDGGNTITVDGTVGVSGTVTVDGSGVTQPVSGTVAVTHAALTELAAAIDTEVQVDVVSSALPSGASTSAKQDTIIGHVDGIEGLLTTIDGDTGNIATATANIETAVELIDDAAATIGTTPLLRVALFDDNNNQVTSFGGSGGTSAADDADFTDGTTLGTPAMGVYESTPSTVTDGDLGVVGITEARRLKTSATVDASLPAGTNNIGDVDVLSIAAGDNNIGNVDIASIAAGDNNIGNVDVVTLPGSAHDAAVSGNPVRVAAYASSSAPTDVSANGDTVNIWADLAGRVQIGDGGGNISIDDGGNTITVDGTVAVTNAGLTELAAAIDTEVQCDIVGSLPAGTNNIGDVDILSIAAGNNNIGDVDIASIAAGDNNIGNVDIVSLPASTNTIEVVGDAAHDAAVAGNPLLVGGYASAAAPSDVSGDGDAVRSWHLRSGAAAVQPTYAGVLAVAGNGGVGTGVQRVTIANDSTGVLATVTNVATIGTSVTPGTSAAHLGKAEDAAHTTGDVGVMALGVRAASPTERSAGPTDGDYEPFGVNAAGAMWMTPTPTTVGGLSIFRSLDLDETEEEVKASAGQVFGWYIHNADASVTHYIKFYNATAANVTVGSTTPVMTLPLSAGATANASFEHGIAFGTAITVAATTGVADNDTGAPSANDVIINVFYK